jgi:hypothetical protein
MSPLNGSYPCMKGQYTAEPWELNFARDKLYSKRTSSLFKPLQYISTSILQSGKLLE